MIPEHTLAPDEPLPAVEASAAPRRSPGVRSRAGNAMERTRAAVLDGASRAVEKHGARRATMGDIAVLAGIAKGTLYNHFRAKDAVYAAAVEAGVRTLAEESALAARDDLAEALTLAAERIGGHPALRRLASDEPAALAAFVTPGDGPTWRLARDGVRGVLDAAGRVSDGPAVEVVLRWLVSFVADPGVDVSRQASLVAAALPAAALPPAIQPPAIQPPASPPPAAQSVTAEPPVTQSASAQSGAAQSGAAQSGAAQSPSA